MKFKHIIALNILLSISVLVFAFNKSKSEKLAKLDVIILKQEKEDLEKELKVSMANTDAYKKEAYRCLGEIVKVNKILLESSK